MGTLNRQSKNKRRIVIFEKGSSDKVDKDEEDLDLLSDGHIWN